jgi:hypothetical protein
LQRATRREEGMLSDTDEQEWKHTNNSEERSA